MYPVSFLEGIQDPKLKTFLESIYFKIHVKIGVLFDVYIKNIEIDAYIYNLDEVVYREIYIDFAIVPRPDVVFVSTFLPIESLLLPDTTKIVRVPPSVNKSPFSITRYNLHRLMTPTYYDLNVDTSIGGTRIKSQVKLYSSDVIETDFGGVVGKPIQLLGIKGN